jgi:serine protease Do
MRKIKIGLLFSVTLALALGGAIGYLAAGPGRQAPGGAVSHTTAVPAMVPPVEPGFAREGFSAIAKQAMPAVVNISSTKTVREQGQDLSPLFSDPFFQNFFGDQFRQQVPRERREQSLGSGVVVRSDGYVLTNDHVVEGADEVKIAFADGRETTAEIVGVDPKIDIAVLKVDESGLPTLPIGDSSQVDVGEIVLAIGNPFGIGQTMTMGIVSATGRGGLGIEDYEDFIQTDAAINPGNSGGALINSRGELIGINTAILSRGMPGNVGVGFAVPIGMASRAMDQILDHGKVIRGFLGVTIQQVTPAIAEAFGLDSARGALVGDVSEDTPASQAGIQKGDVILELDGQPVQDARDLQLRIAEQAPGTRVNLTVFRDGRERDIEVRLAELPDDDVVAGNAGGQPSGEADDIAVEDLTPEIARSLGLPLQTRGVVVDDVGSGSDWAQMGIRRGDVIQEVNRQPVETAREFRRQLREATKPSVLLLVNRGGRTSFVVVERSRD